MNTGQASGTDEGAPEDDVDQARAYLAQVMSEIEDEVRRRRASGDLPARVERELDELFLEFSPVAGRGGSLAEALRLVDSSAFIDPVVPVASDKSGGAVVKKGLRSLGLWYMGYVTHQVSVFASAVSRALHLLEGDVADLRRQLDGQRLPETPVVEVGWAHHADAWWVPGVIDALADAPGRVLHAACGDGWLVRALTAKGIDAYGVDPRRSPVERAEAGPDLVDLRNEALAEHLRATEASSLGALVLTGVVDGAPMGERHQLLDLAADRLAPEGLLIVHSLAPAAWDGDDLPVAADLAPARPLRPATWAALLEERFAGISVEAGPAGGDYRVAGARRDGR